MNEWMSEWFDSIENWDEEDEEKSVFRREKKKIDKKKQNKLKDFHNKKIPNKASSKWLINIKLMH